MWFSITGHLLCFSLNEYDCLFNVLTGLLISKEIVCSIFSLVFMKENKISHLNLKPRNILLNKEVIKIADFLGPKSSESDYVSP